MNLEVKDKYDYIYSPIKENKEQLTIVVNTDVGIKKWIYLLLIISSSSFSTMATTLFLPGLEDIKEDLFAKNYEMDLMLSLFLVTSGLGPLFWGNLAEFKGIKKMYVFSTIITIIASIMGATVGTIDGLILMRIFLGIGTSASRVIGTAYILHFFKDSPRKDWALQAYFISPMLGSSLGPIFGGFITPISWRLAFQVMIVIKVTLLFLIVFIFPKANDEKEYIPNRNLKKGFLFFMIPYKPLKYLRFWAVVASTYIISIAFTSLNAIIAVTPLYMVHIYNIKKREIGYSYIPVFLGGLSAVFIGNPIINSLSQMLQKSKEKIRLKGLLIALVLPILILVFSLISMGFILMKESHIVYALICLFFISLTANAIVSDMSNFVVSLFPKDSNLVSSVPSSLRSIVACLITSFDSTLITDINYIGFMSFLAALNTLSLFVIMIFIYSKIDS